MTTTTEDRAHFRIEGGKLKPSQIITTFGPGAVVDLPDESVMIAGIDHWPEGRVIREIRLESMLEKRWFREPGIDTYNGDIPAVTFPRSRVCSKHSCGRVVSYYKNCPDCESPTHPARLIVICPQGHADDFPWTYWAHQGPTCKNPRIHLYSSGKTATLADLHVKCTSCGKSNSLAGALGGKRMSSTCRGKRPWLIDSQPEPCSQKPRSVLRGASNVYFSSLISALSIPPWTSKIQQLINVHWNTLQSLQDDTVLRLIIPSLPEFKDSNVDDVIRAIKERRFNKPTTISLRLEEFSAFRNPGKGIQDDDFSIRAEPVPATLNTSIQKLVLADRLREVRVLLGFTRIDPADHDNPDAPIVPIALDQDIEWLPAVENRGEGIFFELNEDRVKAWEHNADVQQRAERLKEVNNIWRTQRGLPPLTVLLPRHVLVHTLAHLFIRQLSLDCGYSSASLRERVYAGEKMCGLLIYTASADSDGSLGGLVLQGNTHRFEATISALLQNARWCSSDPLCAEHDPHTSGQVKGAACHACTFVSETSCEFSNRLLDRAFICNLPGMKETGYFDMNL